MKDRKKRIKEVSESLIKDNVSFVSVKEAADISRVTSETIRNLCKKGAIRYQQREQLYFPCKEDVILYARTIYSIHLAEIDIQRLKHQLEKERKELLEKEAKYKQQLANINIPPARLQRMEQLVYALLTHYVKDNKEDIKEREISILFKMFRGEDTSDIANEFQISRARVGQIWTRLLRKIASSKNEIELQEAEIASLRQTIQQIDRKISYDIPKNSPSEDKSNVDLFFGSIDSCKFSTHTLNALHQANIDTIFDLIDHQRHDIELIPNLGKKSLNEIDLWLETHGLDYGMHGVDLSKLKAIAQQS